MQFTDHKMHKSTGRPFRHYELGSAKNSPPAQVLKSTEWELAKGMDGAACETAEILFGCFWLEIMGAQNADHLQIIMQLSECSTPGAVLYIVPSEELRSKY